MKFTLSAQWGMRRTIPSCKLCHLALSRPNDNDCTRTLSQGYSFTHTEASIDADVSELQEPRPDTYSAVSDRQ